MQNIMTDINLLVSLANISHGSGFYALDLITKKVNRVNDKELAMYEF